MAHTDSTTTRGRLGPAINSFWSNPCVVIWATVKLRDANPATGSRDRTEGLRAALKGKPGRTAHSIWTAIPAGRPRRPRHDRRGAEEHCSRDPAGHVGVHRGSPANSYLAGFPLFRRRVRRRPGPVENRSHSTPRFARPAKATRVASQAQDLTIGEVLRAPRAVVTTCLRWCITCSGGNCLSPT